MFFCDLFSHISSVSFKLSQDAIPRAVNQVIQNKENASLVTHLILRDQAIERKDFPTAYNEQSDIFLFVHLNSCTYLLFSKDDFQ